MCKKVFKVINKFLNLKCLNKKIKFLKNYTFGISSHPKTKLSLSPWLIKKYQISHEIISGNGNLECEKFLMSRYLKSLERLCCHTASSARCITQSRIHINLFLS